MPVVINKESGLAEDIPHSDVQSALASTHEVPLVDPQGNFGSAPYDAAAGLVSNGYRQPTTAELTQSLSHAKYSSPQQQYVAGVEGAGTALTFGLSTKAETALGVDPVDIRGRAEANPGTQQLGQAAGLLGGALTGGLEAKALGAVGKGVAGLFGFGDLSFGARMGTEAIKQATEMAMIQGGDETSKMFASDPDQTVQTALSHVGFAAVVGGAFGLGTSGAASMWKATAGNKLNGMLQTLKDKAAGTYKVLPDEIDKAVVDSGVEAPPLVKAALSGDPELQSAYKTLEQSDTTGSGQKAQQTIGDYVKNLGKNVMSALGHDPEAITPEFSKATSGRRIGEALADEYEGQVQPLSERFEQYQKQHGDVPLAEDSKSVTKEAQPDLVNEGPMGSVSSPQAPKDVVTVTPGVASRISEAILQRATQEGWMASPSSDIMREVNRAVSELKGVKSLGDLTNYIKRIGENTASNLPFGMGTPVSRAGGIMKSVAREFEGNVLAEAVGKEGGAEALNGLRDSQKAYAAQSKMKEALDSRLKIGGSTAGYAKGLREMARTDGERILQRMSGKQDSDLFDVLKSFPNTAEAVKKSHIDQLVDNAVNKAKPGQDININHLLKSIQAMEPEARAFAIPKEAIPQIDGAAKVLDTLHAMPHNFSNTARTWDKLARHIPSTALGLISFLTGHSPLASLALGGLADTLGKSGPDAIKLATLTFLGSEAPLEAGAFKSMVSAAQATIKGAKTIEGAVQNVFKSGSEVLPDGLTAKPEHREKLDKYIKAAQIDPTPFSKPGEDLGHYLPGHGLAMSTSISTVLAYLNKLRPDTGSPGPLDPERVPTAMEKATYNRALDIAQQPLTVLAAIKDGTVTPQDVTHISTMYPALNSSLQTKLMAQIQGQTEKGSVPYTTRLGLSLYLGMPLDSSISPSSIIANQTPASPQGQPSTGPTRGTSGQGKAFTHTSASFQSSSQSREQNRAQKA